MLDLDQEASNVGVTGIIGMEASPGISNLMAVKAMGCLDTVEDLLSGWGEDDHEREALEAVGEGASFAAAIEHGPRWCALGCRSRVIHE